MLAGDLTRMCLQSMQPTTFGKLEIVRKPCLISLISTRSMRNFIKFVAWPHKTSVTAFMARDTDDCAIPNPDETPYWKLPFT